MAESELKKVACPSCGAPLLFGAGEITVRCQFCNAVIERPLQADQPAKIKSGPTAREQTPWPPPFSPAVSTPTFRGTAIFLSFLLAIGLILLVVFVIVYRETSSGFTLSVTGPAAALPTDQPEGPDFIVFAYDSPGETYLFARVNPVKGKVVWRGKKFKDISDIQTLVVDGNEFFAVEGTELHAYHATDGVELWRAKLSDKLGYCAECLSIADGRAIVLTQDYVIEAFDSETGESVWKRRMDGYTSGFTIADGGLWVFDAVDGQSGLFLLNLADGTVQKRIASECVRKDGAVSNTPDSISTILLDPQPSVRSSNRSIYLLYGWYPGCIERWDAAAAARVWQTEADEGYSPSKDFDTLFTPETLFFAYDNTLWSASKADGQIRILSEGGDYDLVPLALEQGVLILRTKRTRGTAQFGLRGVDPERGDTLWEYAIENGEPLDPPDPAFPHVDSDTPIWGWRLIDGQIRLFIFQADPNQIIFETIDPKDGSTSGGGTLALDFSWDSYFGPEVLMWKTP